ncbi:DNA replication licensing factor MCM5 [Camellia lanceoleosa]|uniref:DNA replication licensing factor MCM5 n=1 Tax=Camellia lanceoleosa TaxID=1840588 RepID=A0ACC0I1A6_9ERIC|nr:DNA replication licensing factor MCM5 [Camellia lanceoleosa]
MFFTFVVAAPYISKLVKISGITIAASRTKAKATYVTLLCKNCKNVKTVPCHPGLGGAIVPRSCDHIAQPGEEPCPIDPWIVVPDKSKYVDQQTLKLQENPEIEEIKKFASEGNAYQNICSKIAPSILGHDDVKKAVACLLFGGSRKTLPDGVRLRGDINVLLLGDPSTAKSQVLMNLFYLYISGCENSERFTYMWSRVAIHEAMEQQTISIAKAGITTVLNSRTSVLAAANPPSGRYDDLKTAQDNIDLQTTILSRFDLIFIVKDIRMYSQDKSIASHIFKLHASAGATMGDTKTSKEYNWLKRYIQYCRTECHPRLSDSAATMLQESYVKIRKLDMRRQSNETGEVAAIPITVRQLEAIVRLSEALAKMTLMAKSIIDAVLGLSFADSPSNLAAAALFYILTSDIYSWRKWENEASLALDANLQDASFEAMWQHLPQFVFRVTYPNLSSALASVLWELNLLSKHHHPTVSTLALTISTLSSARNQVYHSNILAIIEGESDEEDIFGVADEVASSDAGGEVREAELEVPPAEKSELAVGREDAVFDEVGCIFRPISFACTACVLVGYFWLTFRNQQHYYSRVDIAITGVLVVGALTLEINAFALLLFSEWTILWLIKNKHPQLVAHLGKKFPWLFPMLEKKRWSKKMGQFDLLDFCLEKQFKPLMTVTTWSRTRVEWLAGILDNVNWYMHKTCVNVQSDSKLPGMILRHIKYLADKNTIMRHHNTSFATKLKKLNDEEGDKTYSVQVHFYSKIVAWHIAAEMCYHWDSNTCQSSCTNSTSADGDDGQASIKETCRTLSHYMMYLLNCPLMLGVRVRSVLGHPDDHSLNSHRIKLINDLQGFLKNKNVINVSEACRALENMEVEYLPRSFNWNIREAREFALKLKKKKMEERWEILGTMWFEYDMLCSNEGSDR